MLNSPVSMMALWLIDTYAKHGRFEIDPGKPVKGHVIYFAL
jgi:hypothetical protein